MLDKKNQEKQALTKEINKETKKSHQTKKQK